jgi:hypothetical protein
LLLLSFSNLIEKFLSMPTSNFERGENGEVC